MEWHYPNFTKEEMQCKCGCGLLPLPEFMEFSQALRDRCGFPLIVNSAARCPDHNERVSSTRSRTGPHTLRLAADYKVAGKEAYILVAAALELGATGIGICQKGLMSGRFIHVDIAPNTPGMYRETIWSY